jgi:hypothetical protein
MRKLASSPCIEHLGGNRYRCRKQKFVITTDVLPIRCSCDNRKKARKGKGTGTALVAVWKRWLGEDLCKSGCSPFSLRRDLDGLGPERCREQLEDVVERVMIQSRHRQSKLAALPGPRAVRIVEKLVKWAIRRADATSASKTGTPPELPLPQPPATG